MDTIIGQLKAVRNASPAEFLIRLFQCEGGLRLAANVLPRIGAEPQPLCHACQLFHQPVPQRVQAPLAAM